MEQIRVAGVFWYVESTRFRRRLFQRPVPTSNFWLTVTQYTHTHITTKHILTLRRLMSYIYMEHPFLMFLDHTQRRSTVGRTPLDE